LLFLNIFKSINKGNFGLTDEAIYKSIDYDEQFIPIWGGTEDHSTVERRVSEKGRTKENESITVFSGEGIILSLDGSAGCMTFTKRGKFALNHHAAFLQLRDDARDKVDPEFFNLFYEKQLREASVSKGASATLSTAILKTMDFDMPPYPVQITVMSEIRPLLEKKNEIQTILERIRTLKRLVLAVDYKDYQARNISVNDILDCMSGNSGLTEEEIYQKILLQGQRYEVLSSSTSQATRLGRVPMCHIGSRKLEVFQGKEGLLVIRNGKAGTTFFLDKGYYATTDHAYILTTKQNIQYQLSLKWFMVQYRQLFFEYTSSADNATWNKTGFFETARVDIPSYQEQVTIVNEFERLESLENTLQRLCESIEHVFAREIIPVTT